MKFHLAMILTVAVSVFFSAPSSAQTSGKLNLPTIDKPIIKVCTLVNQDASFLSRRETASGVVAAVSLPQVRAERFKYRKVSRTKPKGISVMSIAFMSDGYGGRIERPRLAFGAMAATPRRAKAAESALEGASLENAATIDAACQAAMSDLAPFDDAIASGWYRRNVAPVHLRRLLTEEIR